MDVVEIARQLIAIPSVNPMGPGTGESSPVEQGVSDFLCEFFSARNIPFQVQPVAEGRANVVARLTSQDGGPTVLLDAHQDTVPVDQMTIAPFAAAIDGVRLSGRGACDVKGPMAAILVTLDRLHSAKEGRRSTVLASFTCDEEHQQLGARRLVGDWTEGRAGNGLLERKPDMAIIAEPTELDVVVAHRGVVRWNLTTHGRAAHSSRPELGVNAIYRMSAVVNLLAEYAQQLTETIERHPLCGPATLSVGVIHGGSSVNVVPDHCTIEVDRRLLPGESAAVAQQQVADFLSERLPFEVQAGEAWCVSDPLIDSNNADLAERLAGVSAQVAGRGQRIGVSYGTHAPRFAAAGIPTVVFGPGSIAQAHTEDEWIEIRQLTQAADVLTRFCSEV